MRASPRSRATGATPSSSLPISCSISDVSSSPSWLRPTEFRQPIRCASLPKRAASEQRELRRTVLLPDIAARMCQAGDEALGDEIAAQHEDDRAAAGLLPPCCQSRTLA